METKTLGQLTREYEARLIDKATVELRAAYDAALARAEAAEKNYRWMVERAADQKLDGYRELGAKAAAAESRLAEATALMCRCAQMLRHTENGPLLKEVSAFLSATPAQAAAPECPGQDWRNRDAGEQLRECWRSREEYATALGATETALREALTALKIQRDANADLDSRRGMALLRVSELEAELQASEKATSLFVVEAQRLNACIARAVAQLERFHAAQEHQQIDPVGYQYAINALEELR